MTLLSMVAGDTAEFAIAVTANALPINLTGMTITFTAKRRRGDLDAAAVIVKTVGAGIVVTDATGGLLTLTIAAADTVALDLRGPSLLWDLQLKDAGGKVRTPLTGRLAISPQITITQ